MPEVISVPRSDKKVELRLRGEDNVLSTNLGTIWKLVPTSPGESKRRSHRAGEAIAKNGRGSGELERDT